MNRNSHTGYAGVNTNEDTEAGKDEEDWREDTALKVEEAPKPVRSYRVAPRQQCSPCGLARILGSVMVAVVVSLIGLSYVPMMFFYADWTLSGNLVVLGLHILVGLTLLSYFQTVFTDPGTVPVEWQEQVSRLRNPPYSKCSKSGLFKPPRSHYCRVTQRLVLNMDHYCPWVNNCVGFFNRKFFILFVSYAALSCGYAAFFLGYKLYTGQVGVYTSRTNRAVTDPDYTPPPGTPPSVSITVMCMMGALIDGVFALTLSIFAMAHMWMAGRNQTTVEGTTVSRPFRLSTKRNLETVFGQNRFYWWLPIWGNGPFGDGVHWQLQDGTWIGLPVESVETEVEVDNKKFDPQQEIELSDFREARSRKTL